MPLAVINSRERGFALLVVLWTLLLLSILAGSFLLEARAARTVAASAAVQFRGRVLADAAINRAIMALLDQRDPLRLPLDGTVREIQFLGHKVGLSCESEAGKVDLNAAPISLLAALFRGQGLTGEQAEALAEQIVIWRSPLRNSSGEDAVAPYQEAGRLYGPRFGSFRTIGELRLVIGMDEALQNVVSPIITVWSRNGVIDRSVAKESLLEALEAANDSLAAGQLAARQRGQAAGSDRPSALGEVLTITARLDVSGIAVTRTAAIQIAGDRREPYRVLSWH